MKRFLIWSLVAVALVLLPTVIGKFRFPATLKSVPSANGEFVAEIRWVPASRSVWLSWFDVLVPTASRMFAVVREPKGEMLFCVPLDLANDVPEDYAWASIVWTGGKVVFSSIRAAEVRIDVILGTVPDSAAAEAQPVARANERAWHVGCGAAFGAKHARGSSVTLGKSNELNPKIPFALWRSKEADAGTGGYADRSYLREDSRRHWADRSR